MRYDLRELVQMDDWQLDWLQQRGRLTLADAAVVRAVKGGIFSADTSTIGNVPKDEAKDFTGDVDYAPTRQPTEDDEPAPADNLGCVDAIVARAVNKGLLLDERDPHREG